MSRSRYVVLCALMMIGAFAGSFAANHAVPVAYAQERVGPTNVRGTAFTLVDQQGRVEGTLRGGTAGAELELDDANGKPRVEISVSGITIRDAVGRLIWSSPKMGILPATTE